MFFSGTQQTHRGGQSVFLPLDQPASPVAQTPQHAATSTLNILNVYVHLPFECMTEMVTDRLGGEVDVPGVFMSSAVIPLCASTRRPEREWPPTPASHCLPLPLNPPFSPSGFVHPGQPRQLCFQPCSLPTLGSGAVLCLWNTMSWIMTGAAEAEAATAVDWQTDLITPASQEKLLLSCP